MVPPWLGTLADNKVWNGHMIVANVSAFDFGGRSNAEDSDWENRNGYKRCC